MSSSTTQIKTPDRIYRSLTVMASTVCAGVRLTCGAHLVTGDTVVGVGGGGVVGAAVQRLLRRCTAAADVAAVQVASVLQHRGAEAHLTELVGGSHRLPGVRRLVVRRESCHVRLCGTHRKSHFTSLIKISTVHMNE